MSESPALIEYENVPQDMPAWRRHFAAAGQIAGLLSMSFCVAAACYLAFAGEHLLKTLSPRLFEAQEKLSGVTAQLQAIRDHARSGEQELRKEIIDLSQRLASLNVTAAEHTAGIKAAQEALELLKNTVAGLEQAAKSEEPHDRAKDQAAGDPQTAATPAAVTAAPARDTPADGIGFSAAVAGQEGKRPATADKPGVSHKQAAQPQIAPPAPAGEPAWYTRPADYLGRWLRKLITVEKDKAV